MKYVNKPLQFILFLSVFFLFACKDLTETNINPNGSDPETINPVFLLTQVETDLATRYLKMNYDEYFNGVMQMAQKDAFSSAFNDYDLDDGQVSWAAYYETLTDNETALRRAEEEGDDFSIAVALTLKSFGFGLIADLWGDAPYSDALKGDLGGPENTHPKYDTQKEIYLGIIHDLKEAGSMFENATVQGDGTWDVIYQGDAAKWKNFANSLLLRYYMRISEKEDFSDDFAQIVNSGDYISDPEDDANVAYPGTRGDDSWPLNIEFNPKDQGSNFNRIKLSKTFRDTLQLYNDPRLGVWFAKVQIPIVVDHPPYSHSSSDRTEDGVRYIHDTSSLVSNPEVFDTNPDYVGIPTSIKNEPFDYNLNPNPNQTTSLNPHVSYLNNRYREASGPLLQARLSSSAEVAFLLAEAANKGWIGNEQQHYEKGIENSFKTWGVESEYSNYISQAGVAWDGSLDQILFQKWIASWTMSVESWLDWRRTGFPDLKVGPHAKRNRMMVRFYYSSDELSENAKNVQEALDRLEETNFSGPEGINSSWSKPWIIQGTGKPW